MCLLCRRFTYAYSCFIIECRNISGFAATKNQIFGSDLYYFNVCYMTYSKCRSTRSTASVSITECRTITLVPCSDFLFSVVVAARKLRLFYSQDICSYQNMFLIMFLDFQNSLRDMQKHFYMSFDILCRYSKKCSMFF